MACVLRTVINKTIMITMDEQTPVKANYTLKDVKLSA